MHSAADDSWPRPWPSLPIVVVNALIAPVVGYRRFVYGQSRRCSGLVVIKIKTVCYIGGITVIINFQAIITVPGTEYCEHTTVNYLRYIYNLWAETRQNQYKREFIELGKTHLKRRRWRIRQCSRSKTNASDDRSGTLSEHTLWNLVRITCELKKEITFLLR